MKRLILFSSMVLLLISCNREDNLINPEVSISSYKITSTTVSQTAVGWKTVTIGNLLNGKLFSTTVERFVNGISTGQPIINEQYEYNNGLLVSYLNINNNNRKLDYYYDAQNRLIGANMTLTYDQSTTHTKFYRFVHFSDSIVYFEVVSAIYNDATAELLSRIIIEFNSNDDVVLAGRDYDLDGIIDNQNQFSYQDGNLVSKSINGTVFNYEYSNIKDSFYFLQEKSYGKKNLGIINSESFVYDLLKNFNFCSKNILSQELLTNMYDISGNNFYKKKTEITNLDLGPDYYQNTRVTEFFFN